MNTIVKITVTATGVVLIFLLDSMLAPEAQAVAGVRRRTAVRTAVVVESANSAQQAQTQPQAAAPPPSQAQPQAAAPPPSGEGALPLGKVVNALPAGCTTTTSGGTEYYHCGANYYRTAFQGSQLVYVTAQP